MSLSSQNFLNITQFDRLNISPSFTIINEHGAFFHKPNQFDQETINIWISHNTNVYTAWE